MSKYGEVRNDYYNEKENKVYIDAWFTYDDNEEGIVVAKVNYKTKEVEYLDEDARTDEYVQEVINETLKNIDDGDFEIKFEEEVKMNKKNNMAYWDGIDGLAEDYVRELLAYSQSPTKVDVDEDEDDVFMEVSKEITELAVKLLEERFGADFPYVNENY